MRIRSVLPILFSAAFGVLLFAADCSAAALPRCTFNNPKTATLSFGVLDPSIGNDVTGTLSAANPVLTFRCTGPGAGPFVFAVTEIGLNDVGAIHRMVNINPAPVPSEYIPYSLTISISPPSPAAKNQIISVSIVSPIVFGSDYRSAYWGDYSDTLTLSLSP